MQYWIAIAIVVLLVIAAITSRGAMPRRRGIVLISAIGVAVLVVEVLVRRGIIGGGDAGPALVVTSIGTLWLATTLRRPGHPGSQGGRPLQ